MDLLEFSASVVGSYVLALGEFEHNAGELFIARTIRTVIV